VANSSRCLTVVRIVAVGIVAVLAAPSAASAAGPTSSSGNGTAGGPGSFIVTLRPDADAPAIAREFGRQGVEVSNVYRRAISDFAGQMSPATVDRLRRDPRVLGVERDGIVRATATQANAPWGLDRVDQTSRPLDGSYSYDTTGAGVTVYVVDSGTRPTHVDFGGRVAAGYTAINDGRGTADGRRPPLRLPRPRSSQRNIRPASAAATPALVRATTRVEHHRCRGDISRHRLGANRRPLRLGQSLLFPSFKLR
jgi:subtilisin family serine protease